MIVPISHYQFFQCFQKWLNVISMTVSMPVCLRTTLSDHGQSKFRKQLSSETAVVKIIDQLTNLNKDHISALTMIDFRKEEHQILLMKLGAYSVAKTSSSWFQSYLINRQQFVPIDGSDTEPSVIKHGVPWGSILESLSFILFINNLLFYVLSSQIDL